MVKERKAKELEKMDDRKNIDGKREYGGWLSYNWEVGRWHNSGGVD